MMRRWFRFAALVLGLCDLHAAQARTSVEAVVLAVDAEFRRAMVEGDSAALARLVANDAGTVHGDHGGVQDKAGLMKGFRTYGIEGYERTPVLSIVRPDMAVLVSVTMKRFAGGRTVETTTTEVLMRRSGRWRIVVLQNTDHAAG